MLTLSLALVRAFLIPPDVHVPSRDGYTQLFHTATPDYLGLHMDRNGLVVKRRSKVYKDLSCIHVCRGSFRVCATVVNEEFKRCQVCFGLGILSEDVKLDLRLTDRASRCKRLKVGFVCALTLLLNMSRQILA